MAAVLESRNYARLQGRSSAIVSIPGLIHLRHLLPYIRRHRASVTGGVVLLALSRLAEAAIPLLLLVAFDSLDRERPDLVAPALGILALTACRFVFFMLARRVVWRFAAGVTYDLRE